MVAVESDASSGGQTVVLRPNLAPNWTLTVVMYFVIATTSLLVAAVYTYVGFWPVLPFAGVELGLLGWALYISARRAQEREVIIIRAGRVEIQKGRRRPERSWVFESYWTEVALRPSAHRWYASRLALRSRGEEVEVGGFLRDEERAELAGRLARWLGPMAASGECA